MVEEVDGTHHQAISAGLEQNGQIAYLRARKLGVIGDQVEVKPSAFTALETDCGKFLGCRIDHARERPVIDTLRPVFQRDRSRATGCSISDLIMD